MTHATKSTPTTHCEVNMNYYVEIVEQKTDHVEKRMGPMGERRAEIVERGASRNLDHDNYYTRIVSEKP